MYTEQFFVEGLACASYLVGCEAHGVAAIVDPDREVQKYIDLDVRQPEEWLDHHIPGSALIPLGELPARLAEVPRDQEILVVCRSGNRSAEGRDIFLQAGYESVTSMAGGLNQWRAAGFSTVSGP